LIRVTLPHYIVHPHFPARALFPTLPCPPALFSFAHGGAMLGSRFKPGPIPCPFRPPLLACARYPLPPGASATVPPFFSPGALMPPQLSCLKAVIRRRAFPNPAYPRGRAFPPRFAVAELRVGGHETLARCRLCFAA